MKQSVKKGDKGEELVINELEKMNDEQYLINNLIILSDNDVSHQFDHILIRHNGVFIIETKNYFGKITGNQDDTYWYKTYINKRKVIKDKFMNPIKQNNAHIRVLKKLIGKDIPFINFVVFVNNDVSHLGIYRVVNLDQLNIRIKTWEIDNPIDSNKMKRINDVLLYSEADMQNIDHVKNIKKMKKDRYTK